MKRRRMTGQERHQQILDAAVDVFAQRGHRSSAMREVADACGITEPLIYRYFGSRKELLLATIRRAAERVLEIWDERVSGLPDALSRIRMLADDDLSDEVCGLAGGVLLQARADAGSDGDVCAAVSAGVRLRHHFIRALVLETQREGKLRADVCPDMVAWQVLGVLLSATMYQRLSVACPPRTVLLEMALRGAIAPGVHGGIVREASPT